MKKLIVVICWLLASHIAIAGEMSCTTLDRLDNRVTPVDLTQSTIDCIKKGRFRDGVALYLLMGAYGWFDKMRVVDESAHQAIPALKMYISEELSQVERQKNWEQAVDQTMEKKNLARFCTAVKKIGMPSYYPDYMIKHGLAAFNNSEKATVYSDFNGPMVWRSTMQGYLKCKE
jgi:hypothetical protein